jgi:hypothetical protein
LRDQLHIRFGGDQRRYAVAKKMMVVGGKNPNRLGIGAHGFTFFLRRS